MDVQKIRSFLVEKTQTARYARNASVSKHAIHHNRLNQAYRAVDWNLRQPWNDGEDGVILPKWAIYVLLDAAKAREDTQSERRMWQIVGLAAITLISAGIFIGIVLFGG